MVDCAIEYLPNRYSRKDIHPERNFLFLNESITTVTPDGKIYVMGGQFYNKHSNLTYNLLIPNKNQNS